MERKKRAKKLQIERGNCKGCKYRVSIGGPGGVCDFFVEERRFRRLDSRGNCIENRREEKTWRD